MRSESVLIATLLAGNFIVATCATMLMAVLPDLSRSLQTDVAQVGQLVTLSGIVMCVVAPLAPAAGRRLGRRGLLGAALVIQGLALLLSSTQSTLGGLFVSRALQVVGPAVFTAQAAALVGLLLPHRLGQVTATIYLGWPLALVLGMPAAGWFTAVLGWPWVFATLGVLSLLTAAAVWHALAPFSTHAQPVRSAASRRIAAGVWPCLMTTAMASAAQLMLLTYFTSYGRDVLRAASTDLAVALTALGCLGVLGVAGVGRLVDRIGASRAVALCLTFMAASMLAWPLASNLCLSVLVLTPWALAAFALNAAQQARLLHLDAAAGPRNVGLNTSCVYLGQAVGAAMGGYWIAHHGYHGLGGASLGLLALAALASMFSSRQSLNARPMHGDGRP